MSVRVLESKDGEAVLYCSTSGWAFGPLMENADVAHAFLGSLSDDARRFTDSDLGNRYSEFVRTNVCECGELRHTECYMCNSPSLYEPALGGTHLELVDDVAVECHKCELEPEPVAGERYVCSYCKREDR